MAAERLSMRQIPEILRQKWAVGFSHRAVARSLGIGLGTITSVVRRAHGAGLDWPQVQTLADDVLEARLYGRPEVAGQRQRPWPDCAWIHAERRRPGVTLDVARHVKTRKSGPARRDALTGSVLPLSGQPARVMGGAQDLPGLSGATLGRAAAWSDRAAMASSSNSHARFSGTSRIPRFSRSVDTQRSFSPSTTAAAVRSRRTGWPARGPVAMSSWMEAAA